MFFKERIDEQEKEKDPLKDKITFTHSWTITPPPPNENSVTPSLGSAFFLTTYNFHTALWSIILKGNHFIVCDLECLDNVRRNRSWKGSSCIVSYNLYSDNDMKVLTYSSSRIKMLDSPDYDYFNAPSGFMAKYVGALGEGKIAKFVISVELCLPSKYFYRPFKMPSCELNRKFYDEYPIDMESDFKFEFLKESDYTFKCPDGTMPAMRMVLNNASKFMYEHFETSEDIELVVEHLIDVTMPVVIFLHTLCFEMPKSYDLDFAYRLLKAINFFKPAGQVHILKKCIHQALCQKFVEEKHTFYSILQWLKIACRRRFRELETMVTTVIADKFFYEWNQTFPENAIFCYTPLLLDVFGIGGLDKYIFKRHRIESIMKDSFVTNVILD